jgi:hypothetical protein
MDYCVIVRYHRVMSLDDLGIHFLNGRKGTTAILYDVAMSKMFV